MARDTKDFIVSPQSKNEGARDEFVSVILLGENHGYRMKSYGPTSLIDLDGITLLEKQVNVIKSVFPKFEILLCSGFDSQKVVNFVKGSLSHINIRVIENQIYNNSNCCESLRLCLNNTMNTRFIVCNGELILNAEQLRKIDLNVCSVLTQESNPNQNLDVGVIHNKGKVEHMSMGIKASHWSEIFALSGPKAINALRNIVTPPEYKNKFVFEAINELVKKQKIAVINSSDVPLYKINNIKTLKRVTNETGN